MAVQLPAQWPVCSHKFVYVASVAYGQVKTEDSPNFGKVKMGEDKKGIFILQCGDGAELLPVGIFEPGFHVGWIAPHPYNGFLYIAGNGQTHAVKGLPDGQLEIFCSRGNCSVGNCCYLEVSRCGRWIVCANYSAGNVACLPVMPDGSLGDAVDSKQHSHLALLEKLDPALADRQEACHTHQIRLDPQTSRWALVCDLGADRIWIYAFDSERGALVGAANSARHLRMPAGSGPRHLDFHPNGRWVYLLCELDGNHVVCDWDAASGTLAPKQTIYGLPEGVACSRAHNSGNAQILVSPDGRTVYSSSRTANAIMVYRVDAATGCLEKLQDVPSGGITPRHFILDFTTQVPKLRCGNQDSQNVVTFSINQDGTLGEAVVVETTGICPCVVTLPLAPRL